MIPRASKNKPTRKRTSRPIYSSYGVQLDSSHRHHIIGKCCSRRASGRWPIVPPSNPKLILSCRLRKCETSS